MCGASQRAGLERDGPARHGLSPEFPEQPPLLRVLHARTARVTRCSRRGSSRFTANAARARAPARPRKPSCAAFQSGQAMALGRPPRFRSRRLPVPGARRRRHAQQCAETGTTSTARCMRIDVNGGTPYAIPADNPLGAAAAACERSMPWGCAIRGVGVRPGDRRAVGRRRRPERPREVNNLVNGGNYGWNNCEGTLFHFSASCNYGSYDRPVLEYARSRRRISGNAGRSAATYTAAPPCPASTVPICTATPTASCSDITRRLGPYGPARRRRWLHHPLVRGEPFDHESMRSRSAPS